MSDTFDVIMAGYPSVEAAHRDFDELVRLVKDKKVRSEGVILVEHDVDGEVRSPQTGDHLGRKGMGWGGGVGVLVGLAAPPLLAATVVGAAAGGDRRQVRQAQGRDAVSRAGLGEALKPGTAAIIAIVRGGPAASASSRRWPGAPAKSVAPMDKQGLTRR